MSSDCCAGWKLQRLQQHGESDAIACDPTRPEDCLTYCYVMDDGSMVRMFQSA